jgi:hypothetical protein
MKSISAFAIVVSILASTVAMPSHAETFSNGLSLRNGTHTNGLSLRNGVDLKGMVFKRVRPDLRTQNSSTPGGSSPSTEEASEAMQGISLSQVKIAMPK